MPAWVEFRNFIDAQRAEIYVMDFIGAWGYTASDFLLDYKALGDVQQVEVIVSSNGGDPLTAFAIAEFMRLSPAKVTTRVVGIAASAASIVAMAGDEVVMSEDSFIMIHDAAAVMGFGDVMSSDDLAEAKNALDRVQDQIVSFYSRRTGLSTEEVVALMRASTYLSAAEAVEKGFADRIDASPMKMAACVDLSVLNAPAHVAAVVRHRDEPDVVLTPEDKIMAEPAAQLPAGVPATDLDQLAADARAAGVLEATARVTEIMDLCTLANQPHRAAEFVNSDKSIADIRQLLIDARAARPSDEVDTRHATSDPTATWDQAFSAYRPHGGRVITNRL